MEFEINIECRFIYPFTENVLFKVLLQYWDLLFHHLKCGG